MNPLRTRFTATVGVLGLIGATWTGVALAQTDDGPDTPEIELPADAGSNPGIDEEPEDPAPEDPAPEDPAPDKERDEADTEPFDDLEDFDDFDDEHEAAWMAFDECLDASVDWPDESLFENEDLTDEEIEALEAEIDWDALDAQFEAAEEACLALLPEEIRVEEQAWEAYDQCLSDNGVVWPEDQFFDDPANEHLTDEEFEALFDAIDWDAFDASIEAADAVCFSQLPPEIQEMELEWKAEEEIWEAYDQCLSDHGVVWPEDQFFADPAHDDLSDEEIDQLIDESIDWEAFDQQFFAAEQACFDLLPPEIQEEEREWMEMEAAWMAYDECLADNGVVWPDDEEWDDPSFDWDAFDATVVPAEEACAPLLPEDFEDCAEHDEDDDDFEDDHDDLEPDDEADATDASAGASVALLLSI